ncbi:MAG: hypothetical protein KC561_04215 [Myxococcales bacterium]|nr:hypothetical protein [Myxococcales bacterium]
MAKRRKPEVNPFTADRPLTVGGALIEVQTVSKPATAAGLQVRLLRILPSYKDTVTGRSGAKQFKVATAAIGLLLALLSGQVAFAVLGFTMVGAAVFLPVKADWKRTRIAQLRKGTRTTRQVNREAVDLGFDGKRVFVTKQGKTWRRVLVDRGEHVIEDRRSENPATLGILPGSQRRAESIWLTSADLSSNEANGQQGVIEISAEDLERFVEAVEKWSPPRKAA